MDGQGVFIEPEFRLTLGHFKRNLFHGECVCITASGCIEIGTFSNGLLEGKLKKINDQGETTFSLYKDDKFVKDLKVKSVTKTLNE